MADLVAGESPLGAAASSSAWPPAVRRLRRRRALRRWRCFRGHRVQALGHLPQPHGMAGAARRALSFMHALMLPNQPTPWPTRGLAAPSSSRSFVQRARRRHTAWDRGDPLQFLILPTPRMLCSVPKSKEARTRRFCVLKHFLMRRFRYGATGTCTSQKGAV